MARTVYHTTIRPILCIVLAWINVCSHTPSSDLAIWQSIGESDYSHTSRLAEKALSRASSLSLGLDDDDLDPFQAIEKKGYHWDTFDEAVAAVQGTANAPAMFSRPAHQTFNEPPPSNQQAFFEQQHQFPQSSMLPPPTPQMSMNMA
ncbi:hypothetical protein K3495_g15800, partial [Podosphaera aphanis]